MYTCAYDDDLAEIVKKAAMRDERSIKGQFTYYLKKALREEGLLENPDNKKQIALAKVINLLLLNPKLKESNQ